MESTFLQNVRNGRMPRGFIVAGIPRTEMVRLHEVLRDLIPTSGTIVNRPHAHFRPFKNQESIVCL